MFPKIGFMRSGRILVEGSPSKIKSRFGRPSLDDVFLALCLEDEKEGGGGGGDRDTTDAVSRRLVNTTNGHAVMNKGEPPPSPCELQAWDDVIS